MRPVSITCATNAELLRMVVKPSFTNHWRLIILQEMISRGL